MINRIEQENNKYSFVLVQRASSAQKKRVALGKTRAVATPYNRLTLEKTRVLLSSSIIKQLGEGDDEKHHGPDYEFSD